MRQYYTLSRENNNGVGTYLLNQNYNACDVSGVSHLFSDRMTM